MRRVYFVIVAAALVLGLGTTACSKPEPEKKQEEQKKDPTPTPTPTPTPAEDEKPAGYDEATCRAVNYFMRNAFGVFYLWESECADNLKKWAMTDNPKDGYEKYKYKDDRWGFVRDDYDYVSAVFDGEDKTNGMSGSLIRYNPGGKLPADTLSYIVEYVYKGSPAERAGLRRGALITKFNGKAYLYTGKETQADIDKINETFNNIFSAEEATFTLAGSGKTVKLTSVVMYCDPILKSKVFDFGGKKVGYLCFNAFDMESIDSLHSVFKDFKSQGVSELIMDLRYNGGGYVVTEVFLASMIAPESVVKNKEVFTQTVYNKALTGVWGGEDSYTRFTTKDSFEVSKKKYSYDITNDILSPKKMYVIYTGDSASASEALVVGLKPYMDISIFGEQSYGKYSSCTLLSGKSWYDTYKDDISGTYYDNGIKYASNWCCYVTFGRFADKNGETGNYPNGFPIPTANQVYDTPYDGYDFGDPEETMLAKVLESAGYVSPKSASNSRAGDFKEVEGLNRKGDDYGLNILLPSQLRKAPLVE